MNGYYSEEELYGLGIKKVGKNVLISKKASLYMTELMEFGNNIRIDDFCHLTGRVVLGNYIHIAPYTNIAAMDVGVEMEDYSGLSARVSVYAVSDDYSGKTMTNPMVPEEFKEIIKGKVIIKKHSIIGVGSVILPGVVIGEGTACGAMSLIKENTKPWGIYIGVPAKRVKERKKDLLSLEKNMDTER